MMQKDAPRLGKSALLEKATRFSLTGMLVTTVHAVIAVTCIRHLSLPPPVANGLAFVGATIVSYIINTNWSFSTLPDRRTLVRFTVVSIAGFLLSIFVAWIAQTLSLHYITGIAAVAITVPPITFALHNFWTYK